MSELELQHYGVKGMKWGVRRYQNTDGSLTAAGKKRARQEVRADNRKAFELGKEATISGHAAAKAAGRTIKYENKVDKQFDKDPDGIDSRTKKLLKKWVAAANTSLQLSGKYSKDRAAVEEHYKKLVDKYGEDAVSSISYKDVKLPNGKYSPSSMRVMNEKTTRTSERVGATVASVGSVALMYLMDTPFAAVVIPRSTRSMAAEVERTTYRQNLKAGRQPTR